MSKLKELLRSWKVWIMIIAIALSLIAIWPNPFAHGVLIQSVDTNSSAQSNGLSSGIIIESINGHTIEDVNDFSNIITNLSPGDIVTLLTDSGQYKIIAESKNNLTSLGITVGEVASSNLKKGLDMAGGVRALLKPAEKVDSQTLQDIISITSTRLNTYGVSDINVRQVSDLAGNDYILVEVPGANKEEVSNLLQKQGKFEAKIGNETIFNGGTDIKGVCRSPDCSGIDTKTGCGQTDNGWSCRYQFRVDISPEAAKKHADATRKLGIITEGGERYLDKKLDLYLDDELVSSLFISEDLQGSETTSFTIQGPGTGATKQDAQVDSFARMKEMQTVLISGSLPVKLDIAKMDIVSPVLGANFLKLALIGIALSIAAVAAIIFARYRKIKIVIPVVLTGLVEVLVILGFAAMIKWRLDLAAIAGIVVTIGTGVNAQIIITEELLSGTKEESITEWKSKIKNAFFIIFCSYFTSVAAMVPLWWMGAGLVKGFAVTTVVGITAGILITRPAYAKIIEVVLKD